MKNCLDSSGQNQFFPIKLSPDLPNNILATGYSGLRLSTQSNSVLTYIACNWVAVSGNVRFEQFFYANFVNNILCEDLFLNSEVQWNITCNFIGGIVNTSLIVISPLQAGFWKISIECREDESSYQDETVSIKINVSGENDLYRVLFKEQDLLSEITFNPKCPKMSIKQNQNLRF